MIDIELKEKKMKLVVNRVHNLPTPPVVFEQISKVINDPDTSAYDIANIISEDPALTAKILRLTNSSFYGIPRTVTSVKQAIVILGIEVVKSLIISASVFEIFAKKYKLDKAYLESFWRHSLSAAFMARILSRKGERLSPMEAEQFFSAGLLHDIGKLVIITELAADYKIIKESLDKDNTLTGYAAEAAVMGIDHSDIGAFLCSKWNLPEALCEAIANHHREELVATQKYTAAIHLANHLAHQMESPDEPLPNFSPLFNDVWQVLGLSQGQESSLIEALKGEFSQAETFLNIARGL
jgi:putative nucleotidyltransferase with HDIG domain